MNQYLIPKGYDGLAVYPFIILRRSALRSNTAFLNHERIHIRQQAEMLIIPFYLWYAVEFVIRLVKYRNPDLAYRNISFEREAYQNEKLSAYLDKRPFWNFLKFI